MSIGNAVRRVCLASAKLPVYGGHDMKIHVFGSDTDVEIAALVHRTADAGDTATVRLHSACLTGDVFGSAKCDCGAQLRLAIDAISRADHGIVLYFMHHEGRGIGLLNKVKAYALQDEGLDTVEANVALGFEPDIRDFSLASHALRELGVSRIRLLTNNPDKVAAMQRSGIDVIERVTLDAPITKHNRDYLATKRRFFGHMPARDPVTDYLAPHAFAELFTSHMVAAPETTDSWAIDLAFESYREVRDSLGIDAANAMLQAVSERLKSIIRADEVVARAADDRILVILKGVPERVAEQVTARIREAFLDMAFEWNDQSNPVAVEVAVFRLAPGQDPVSGLSVGNPPIQASGPRRVAQ
jgi:GTP cyclohydrolase II